MRIDLSAVLRCVVPVLLGLVLGAALAAAAGAAESSGQSLKQSAAATYDDIKTYSYEQKEQLSRWLDEQMRAADQEIAALEIKAKQAGETASRKWQTTRLALAEKRAALSARANALGETGRDAWEGAKQSVAGAYDDLKQGFRDARTSME